MSEKRIKKSGDGKDIYPQISQIEADFEEQFKIQEIKIVSRKGGKIAKNKRMRRSIFYIVAKAQS